MLDELFMQVLDMTKMASVVILAVMLARLLLRLLLRRAPKVFSYGLWAVVLFRLLCPVSFEAPVSILPEVRPVAESYSLAEESISLAGAGEAVYQAVGDALNGGLGIQHIRTTERNAEGMTRYVTSYWWEVWVLFGQYVWAAGLGIMLLYSVVSYGKLRRRLEVALPLRDNIFVADDIQTPFVMGMFRPRIYLPCGLGQKEQAYIILHEQHHIKRRDHVIKGLAFLALCIHWFNPLVWLAFSLANQDMEMSCDEAVVRKMGQQVRADYSASLLSLATGHRMILGAPLAFGEGNPKSRIRNLANWRKPAFWVVLVAFAGCAVLVFCLLADPVSEDNRLSEMEDSRFSETEYNENENAAGEEAVGELEAAGGVVMVPTSADMEGVFDGFLYLSLDGETYRFECTNLDPGQVAADQLLEQFTEEADPQDVNWKVYSLKEYPDLSVVLAVAGSDYRYLYQYSPSRRVDGEALQQVKDAGCVVMEDGDVSAGQEIWQAFVDATEEGRRASVKLAYYNTLNPERCSEEYYEAHKEDYPSLYVLDLIYDGSGYQVKQQGGSADGERNFKYLMCYVGEPSSPSALFDTYTRYVLTNDDTVTWEDIWHGMLSSQLGDAIEHFTVYTDLEYEE